MNDRSKNESAARELSMQAPETESIARDLDEMIFEEAETRHSDR